jgi:lipopolysaccharide cholinephosphotransferase
MPYHVYDGYQEVMFEGKKCRLPMDYHYYLTSLFGDYMELPPEEKRISHNMDAYFVDD